MAQNYIIMPKKGFLDIEFLESPKEGQIKSVSRSIGNRLCRIRYKSSEKWLLDGLLHRDDGPAYIEIKKTNDYEYRWHRRGRLHRDDGPAIETRMSLGSENGPSNPGYILSEHWFRNGRSYRDDDLPTYISRVVRGSSPEGPIKTDDGSLISKRIHPTVTYIWHLDEGCYRPSRLPPCIVDQGVTDVIDLDGKRSTWTVNGKTIESYHANERSYRWGTYQETKRINGPSTIIHRGYTEHWEDGVLVSTHRCDDPTFIYANNNGRIPAFQIDEWMTHQRHGGINPLGDPFFLDPIDEYAFIMAFHGAS